MRSKFAPFLLALLALFPAAAHSQTRDPDFPISDNEAFSFALHGDTLLLGGNFRHLGPTRARSWESTWPRVGLGRTGRASTVRSTPA